jgi:glycosyltransferase involved in cell wall biosynthesis
MNSVSVVVSTFTKKRLPSILQCISSLEKQTVHPAEIVLVLDPIDELIDFYNSRVPPNVRIIVSEGAGLSFARNAGVKNAVGDIIAFIDDDAVADAKWLEKSLENYRHSEVIGVGGAIYASWQINRPPCFPQELDWIVGCSYRGLPLKRTELRNPIGCNMSFRKKGFEKAGYFKTDIGRCGNTLLCNEETEFSIRALSLVPGSKIIYEPSAIVYHKVSKNRESFKYIWTRSFYEGISKAIISSKTDSSKILYTEGSYLRLLLSKAIPLRLRHIYKPRIAGELFTLLLSLSGVFAGFAAGRITKGFKD